MNSEDGCFYLSHEPGLGVELDVDAAAEFPQQQAGRDFVLDSGPCEVGVESTIADATGDVPSVLRPGGG